MHFRLHETDTMETRFPLIVDIKRGSLDDGPGVRTVVFFKGCPLHCVFCQNPEAQELRPELAFTVERCIRCGACAKVCAHDAIDLSSPARLDRSRCDRCGKCAEVCPSGALRILGKSWPVEELVALLVRDAPFYRHSGGGVTFSGGECTLFADYLSRVLRELKARGIHTAIETCGHFDYDVFARLILPFVDLIFFDLKMMDTAASKRWLGCSNELIVANLKRLLSEAALSQMTPDQSQVAERIHPRIPLIPGITDTRENLAAIIAELCALGAKHVSLLPYNPLGLSMYARLGRPTPALPRTFTAPQREHEIVATFRELLTIYE